MKVELSFLEGTEVMIDIHLTKIEAEPLQYLSLMINPDLWPQLGVGRTIEKAKDFAPNDFFLDWYSKLPLPMVPGSHNVFQIVVYDLMDEAEGGLGCRLDVRQILFKILGVTLKEGYTSEKFYQLFQLVINLSLRFLKFPNLSNVTESIYTQLANFSNDSVHFIILSLGRS